MKELSASILRLFKDEELKQQRFFKSAISEGYTLAPNSDPFNLMEKVGRSATLIVLCQELTESHLCKLSLITPTGYSEDFHLIPLWQVLKYQRELPSPGNIYQGRFIIGIRKDSLTRVFVPALRLPRK